MLACAPPTLATGTMAEQAAALEVRSVRAGYGATVVLEALDLRIRPGECVAVLGRNGVSKSTLLATIMGHTSVRDGAILFQGRDIGRWKPHRRALAGLGWVPQERAVFPSLTRRSSLPSRYQVAPDGPAIPGEASKLFISLVMTSNRSPRRRVSAAGVKTSRSPSGVRRIISTLLGKPSSAP